MISNNNLDILQKEIRNCRLCKDIFGFEPHPIVFGHNHSKIMHISQAPSQNVYHTGKPFNDPSGKRLREEWYHISDETFYNPDNFYIVSIAHCYPGKNPKGGDRLPPVSCAKRWLTQILPLVDNKIYLLVGRKASDFFFPKHNFTDLVFQDNEIYGKPAYVLPHPSPLNVKWFRDHPEFTQKRIIEIEKVIHSVLNI
jgi:uracil-DNA glycosylase family 4